MKKNYIFKTFLFLIPLTAFVLMAVSSGRDGGFSGSPGDSSNSCTSCHSGGNFGASVAIQTELPTGGYALNTSYGIQVDVTGSSATKHGFQITAERVSDNAKVGTFTVSGTDNKLVNGGTHVTHTSAGNTKNTWNFNWTSPTTDVGEVKFYVAALAANANGSTSGDQVVTATSSNFNVLSLAKENQLDFTVYPNPVRDNLNIQLPTGVIKADVSVFDMSGKLIRNVNISAQNNTINVSELSTGVYILKLNSEGKLGSRQFIKK
ncbi:choice-of-anchor V domain-containing protein [Polaribacter uvawellassae]|uniref:choice-of-anchor V domain-containing protein n=1 Tax=Polaribacter uvawellassae TaxID=3133495 RepID=UPI00321A73B0